MNRLEKGLILFSVLTAILCLAALSPQGAAASVTPSVADFGQNTVGTSSTIPIYLSNHESSPMTVFVNFRDQTDIFSINVAFINLAPGQTLSLQVTFSPTEVGNFSNALFLLYSQGQSEQVLLQGEGVSVEEEKGIEKLLDFFDQAVKSGTLVGYGSGKSDDGRLNALRNMLVDATSLAEKGEIEAARGKFLALVKKLEVGEQGKSKPFAAGEAVPELISMIQKTVENLSQAL